MLFSENLRVALRALRANKMRSILSMLGIVIGVSTVVALLAIGNGATSSITSSISSSGTNLLTISAGHSKSGFGPGAETSKVASYLYYSDYDVLTRALGTQDITTVVPSYQSAYVAKYQSQSFSVSVTGITPQYADVRSLKTSDGRWISDGDDKSQSLVAVLGSQTAKDLFSGLSPIGKTISINGVKFEVIGVLESKGSSGFGSTDDAIYVPLQTGYAKLFGSNAVHNDKKTVNSIYVSVVSTKKMDTVSAEITFILRQVHNLKATDEVDFSIQNQTDMLQTLSSVTSTLTIFLGAVAGISLLVGGIGIMNIMLVSVTERTKEIGLRKAVGATRNLILMQFLIETVTLTLLGGLVGIALGVGIAEIFTALKLITAVVQASSVLMAFGFAIAIGVFFGLYPAYRAAGLHPMVALRYE